MVSTQGLFEMSRKLTVKMNNSESEEIRSRLNKTGDGSADGQQHQGQRPSSWATSGSSIAGWQPAEGRKLALEEEEKVYSLFKLRAMANKYPNSPIFPSIIIFVLKFRQSTNCRIVFSN
jgi:hypothetical protein